MVLGGEGGGVEVEDGLVLALVEGVVDVDEFWWLVMLVVGIGFREGGTYRPLLRMDPWLKNKSIDES